MKKYKGWKTLGFNLLLVIIGVLETTEMTSLFESETVASSVLVAVGVIGSGLRMITDTPVGKNEQ